MDDRGLPSLLEESEQNLLHHQRLDLPGDDAVDLARAVLLRIAQAEDGFPRALRVGEPDAPGGELGVEFPDLGVQDERRGC